MQTKLEIRNKNLIYVIALFFEIFAMLVDLTTIPYMVGEDTCSRILKVIRYLGYLLVFIKILLDDYTRSQMCVIIGLVGVLFANSISVGGNAILCLFLFIIGMKDIDFNMVCRVTLVFYIAGVGITIFGSLIGVIDNWKYTMGGRTRYSLGYVYPSHATSAIFYTICLFCFVLGKNIRLWHVIFFEIINIWQYRITNSRAGTLLLLFLPMAFYIMKYSKKELKHTVYGWCLSLAFPVCAILSLCASILYNGKGILYKINSLLSNRLYLSNNALKEYGLSLFGEEIKWIGNGGYGYTFTQYEGIYNFVDCSYVKILLDYGIVFFVLIIVGFTMASVYAVKCSDKYLLLSLAFVAVYSIIEPRLIAIGFNPFVLILVVLVNCMNDKNIVKYSRRKKHATT